MTATKIDPTTVATVWHSMQTICKEMRHLVDRTAQNYLIGQLHDLSVGIWEPMAPPSPFPSDCRCSSWGPNSRFATWSRTLLEISIRATSS